MNVGESTLDHEHTVGPQYVYFISFSSFSFLRWISRTPHIYNHLTNCTNDKEGLPELMKSSELIKIIKKKKKEFLKFKNK